jgi:hypothetical protein
MYARNFLPTKKDLPRVIRTPDLKIIEEKAHSVRHYSLALYH